MEETTAERNPQPSSVVTCRCEWERLGPSPSFSLSALTQQIFFFFFFFKGIKKKDRPLPWVVFDSLALALWCKHPELLFYDLNYSNPTPSRFVNLKKFATYE